MSTIKWVNGKVSGRVIEPRGAPRKSVFIDGAEWRVKKLEWSDYETPARVSYDGAPAEFFRRTVSMPVMTLQRGATVQTVRVHPHNTGDDRPIQRVPVALVFSEELKKVTDGKLTALVQYDGEPVAAFALVDVTPCKVEAEQGGQYTKTEFLKLAQAKHKELAQVWQAKAGDDVVAFEAATLWVTLQSWRAVGRALRKKTGKVYSPEGARKAARRFYDVVAGPGKITSDESARAYYTREGRDTQRHHADNIRDEVDDELTQS